MFSISKKYITQISYINPGIVDGLIHIFTQLNFATRQIWITLHVSDMFVYFNLYSHIKLCSSGQS